MEESLISCVLQKGELFDILKDICNYKDFWFQPYSAIWYTFQKLNDKTSNIDLITVSDEMQRNGTLEKLSTFDGRHNDDNALKILQEKEGIILENAETYAYKVREDSSKRKIQELTNKANDWINQGHSALDILTNLDVESGKISAYSNTNAKSTILISDAVDLAMAETEYAKKNNIKYIETGIKAIDEKIGGFFPQQLILIAARSGMGKTALASTIALNASMKNDFTKKVGIFTLEMKNIEYVNRMITSLSGIPYLRLKMGKIHDNEMPIYKETTKLIKENDNILIDDTVGISTSLIRSKIRKMKDWGAQMIIVDQLGLVSDRISGEAEYLRIDRMSYQFKNMAREFDLPLVLLHQMNRGIERENIQRTTKKEPEMKDLDQAGERPSDVIIMITHEKEQKVIKSSKIWIVKNRFGATGSANVKFEAEKTWFRDLTQEELEELEPDIVK
jgi:replicative DNA helicase